MLRLLCDHAAYLSDHTDRVASIVVEVLSHLLHQLGHFPMGLGAAQLTSLVTEQDDVPALRDSELSKEVFSAPNIQLFVLNNMAIVSLVEIPAEETSGGAASVGLTTGKSQVRAIVRDLSGKFSWDCLTLYGPQGCRAGSYPPGEIFAFLEL
ncbi:hypothetical protein V5799_011652 [Amblyomma americanum]|uniref:Uncharacterized protein n=1 Tax=Amblyomma americanum TaxID=6943 RepID=A0AAQ4EG86_AMBAM